MVVFLLFPEPFADAISASTIVIFLLGGAPPPARIEPLGGVTSHL